MQGRGEFGRLALEEARAADKDVVRARGVRAMTALLEGDAAVVVGNPADGAAL